MKLHVLIAAAAISVLTCVTGCSAESEVPSTLPEKNISQWTMPLDQYAFSFNIEANYAENLLVKPCMAKRGWDFPVPWRNLDALHGESFNDLGVRLFNTDLAAKWGYHLAPNPDPSTAAAYAAAAELSNIPPEEDADLVACLDEIRSGELPLLEPQAQGVEVGFVNDAIEGAESEQGVVEAARDWAACMAPAGIADLPDSPRGMPSESLVGRWGLGQDGAASQAPTSDEIQIATMDAKCQESSGYVQRLYDAEWDRQVAVIQAHPDELERVRQQLAEYRKRVFDVINAHAPAH